MPSTESDSGPLAPRHAATVIVARPCSGGSGAFEIFMLVRSARSTFMPSTLVFPGGRLEPEDGSPSEDRAWVRAGRRECTEEAGLDPGDDLTWFDTWLTPSAESRRRYLARFYLARLPASAGAEARADGTETHAGRWSTVHGHLARWESAQVDLPPPTLSTLLRMRDWQWNDLDRLRAIDPTGVILPKVHLEDGIPVIVMPHDAAYADLPGESLPAPARAQDLPSRFVRDKTIWRPLCAPWV
jgi:8-oxo-dGTP pyrophosphatase MutT (NUDIX family)